MAFDYYFTNVPAGSEVGQYLIETNGCLLLSQLYSRSNIKRWIEIFNGMGKVPVKLFIDSGAFTAWTKGTKIDVDEYINFINENKDYFEICAAVDSIPGEPKSSSAATPEQVSISCNETWQNFLYMRSKMLDADKLLWTFHIGEPWECLQKALEYEDSSGKIKYIALGGMVGKTQSVIKDFLQESFTIIKNSSNPNVKVHAFGMTSPSILQNFPLYSADSVSWLMNSGNGVITVNGKNYYVSEKDTISDDNVIHKSPALQEMLEKTVAEFGFTLEELSKDYKKRYLFNVMSLKKWSVDYVYIKPTHKKQSLF